MLDLRKDYYACLCKKKKKNTVTFSTGRVQGMRSRNGPVNQLLAMFRKVNTMSFMV